MDEGMLARRGLLMRLSKWIISHIAPEELALFDRFAAEYFRDPSPPTLAREPDEDPLAAGFGEFLAMATPAALAMTNAALTYIQSKASNGDTSPPTSIIQTVLRDQGHRAAVRQQAYDAGVLFLVEPDTAERMADTLIDALMELETEAQPQHRVINAWIEDLRTGAPLQMNQIYQLCFDVDRPRADVLAASDIDELASAIPPDQDHIEVLILLEAEGIEVHSANPQTLMVPRVGRSSVVQFAVKPARVGSGTINAFFSIGDRVFQRMQICLSVVESAGPSQDALFNIYTSGRTLESALLRPISYQNMSMIIIRKETGYQFIIKSGNGAIKRGLVNISEAQVAELIGYSRDIMLKITKTKVDGMYVYQQEDTLIPSDIHTRSIRELANLGMYLYEKLFYSGRGEEAWAIGDILRTLTQKHRFNIDIIADHFVFPWALLYDRENDDEIELDSFWGFKHTIACLPEFARNSLVHYDPQIVISDKIDIGFICNTQMDSQHQIVQRHGDFLRHLPDVIISEYTNSRSLLDLLKTSSNPHHILYFYCHAVSYLPGEEEGIGRSKLILSDGDVTLIDMNRHAATRLPPFAQAPLVFLNACASARLSPYIYDGFVPYLIGRGARGVLGTEVDTPIPFGAEFAGELLKRFITGQQTLGELLVNLRLEYAQKKKNLLGLLYTLYGGSDTIIKRTPQPE